MLGIEPGDRDQPNSAEWVVVQLATAKIGAIMVCIKSRLPFVRTRVRLE